MDIGMGTGVWITDAEVVQECLAQMRRVRDQMGRLDEYAGTWVAGPQGFTGLLAPLCQALAEIAAASNDLARGLTARYQEVIAGLEASAHDLAAVDELVAAQWVRLTASVAR